MKEKLLEYQSKINRIQNILNLLNWDLRISVPKDSADNLIETISSIEEEKFKLETSDEYKKLLEDFINSKEFETLEEAEARCVKNLLDDILKQRKIPAEFNKEYLELQNKSTLAWTEAKEKQDYEIFKPYLEKCIEMTKEYYGYISDSEDLYEVMLNEYETGLNTKFIDKLFNELKEYLIPLIKELKSENKKISIDYTTDELKKCAEFLLGYEGFDLNKGMVSIFSHGFTEKMSKNDVRIAFSKTSDPTDFVTTIIHEGGHGIFEQNIGDNLSKYGNATLENIYALHESQSKFFENILGRNINFWIPIYDEVQKLLKLDMKIEEFYENLNNVNPGLIRTKSDEVTFCMHIILRYEIERDLFSNKITIDELPEIWNKKMKEYLGVEVKDDSEGLMQDIQWAQGHYGYFPSYLLGQIYDGMFLEIIEKKLGSIDDLLREGKIKEIINFLIENIYKYGNSYNSVEVIKRLGEEEISVKPLIKYFDKKYRKK